ncbi:hypothetical protein [Thalassospira povalilytica]|uniref:hypothetical protein n=1 Tax=Thalassospira povalilytica TaxID=732237 RepID=UPI003AA7BF7F
MEYVKPLNETDPNAPYINGDASQDMEGSEVPAAAIEHTMREIVNAVTFFLGTVETPLPASGEDLQQLRKAIEKAVTDANADALYRTVSATLGAGFWTSPVAATVAAGNVSFNAALGNRFTLTATEALTITAPDPMPAGGSARLELSIDATGNYSIDFGAGFRVNHGAISSEPNAVNLIHMEFNGALVDVHITQRSEA